MIFFRVKEAMMDQEGKRETWLARRTNSLEDDGVLCRDLHTLRPPGKCVEENGHNPR